MACFENYQEAKAAWEEEKDLLFLNDYPFVLSEVKRCGFSTVYDIGSSFGPHVEYASSQGFTYIGIDKSESPMYWSYRDELVNMESLNAKFLFGKQVPFNGFAPVEHSCAISICALGSLYQCDYQTIQDCMRFMTKHFKHFWCSTFVASLEKMRQYWDHFEVLRCGPRAIYHFWNN